MAKSDYDTLGGYFKQQEDQKLAQEAAELSANPFYKPRKKKSPVVKGLKLNAAGAKLGLIYSELLGLPASRKGRRR